ncbi:MAG: aminomethyl-transferring glycine dehydrogenase subunit GcvPB [Anaerolineae bacterium]
MTEPLIFELSSPGRCACFLPALDVPETELPAEWVREDLPLPEVGEADVVRHYVRLSQLNYGVDIGIYPLGSCTMKYNPKVNEVACRLPGFTQTHPYQDHCAVQGNLALMFELQEMLKEIAGFDAVSLQPAAGAHGELTGILIMRKYLHDQGETQRDKILVPDSAHGTNPASTTMSGLRVAEIKSDARGNVDLEALKANLDDTVVGLMLTNPNTLGLFDENVVEICRLVHEAGGLVYADGANLNALMGIAKMADLGFDVMHFNLHKTFSTPHGGGGPGSGPVGVVAKLAPYLPGPIVVVNEGECNCGCSCEQDEICFHLEMPAKSIGRVKAFYGHFGVMVRAYTYIRMLGAAGLREASENAVLNANYLKALIEGTYPIPYDRLCMHEFVAEGKIEGAPDVRALDISKRLIDYGFHPPTNYFPLIVHESLMIEPTETESKDTLDAFAYALLKIAEEARTNPQVLHEAPHNAPVSRLDEVQAARNPILRWKPNT